MKTAIAIAILVLTAAVAGAASVESTLETRKLVDEAMAKFNAGDVPGGMAVLKSRSGYAESDFEDLQRDVSAQEAAAREAFGAPAGAELFKETGAGKSLLKLVYFQKFAKHPLRWKFVFYRPRDTWKLIAVGCDFESAVFFDSRAAKKRE